MALGLSDNTLFACQKAGAGYIVGSMRMSVCLSDCVISFLLNEIFLKVRHIFHQTTVQSLS